MVKLYEDCKPIREIAHQAHLSFGTIGNIIKRLNGLENNETLPADISNKSKETQALFLFAKGKRPIDVAIELNLPSHRSREYITRILGINNLDELACILLRNQKSS